MSYCRQARYYATSDYVSTDLLPVLHGKHPRTTSVVMPAASVITGGQGLPTSTSSPLPPSSLAALSLIEEQGRGMGPLLTFKDPQLERSFLLGHENRSTVVERFAPFVVYFPLMVRAKQLGIHLFDIVPGWMISLHVLYGALLLALPLRRRRVLESKRKVGAWGCRGCAVARFF